MELNEFCKEIEEKSSKIDINLDNEICNKLYNYMNLLLEWNEKINLTAITDEKEIILKHFIDSFTINKFINSGDIMLDIGTGAGFPGLPIKIIRPEVDVFLMDSLNKRINFLNEVIESLQLKNIEAFHSRAEEMAKNNKFREKFDVVTSRAVAKLNILLEYMLPYTKIDGKCLCMKGPNIEEEIKEAEKALKILGGEIEKIEKIILPDSNIERNIIIIRKKSATPLKYPRKAGMPTKEPL